ncbi:MAG: PAS domain S-box protein [Gammaproteobacteria bacterium]|nr:PAS domain S-box protein [Gammaproteobacteria bacterium]
MDTTPKIDSTVSSQSERFPGFMFLALFLPIAILVFLAGIYFASQRTDTRIKEILGSDSARLNHITGFLGAEVLGSLKHLRSLSAETVTKQALDSPDPEHLRLLESSFLTLARRNPQYQQVRWIDESGIEKARVMRDQGEPYAAARQDLQDKSTRYYFEAANALLPGELYISRVDLNVEHGQIEMPARPVLRIATPVENSGHKRRGIFVINIEMKHLFNLVRTPGETQLEADYLLVNQQGVILNGDIENFKSADAQEQSVDFILPDPEVRERVSASDSGSLELRDGLWTWKKLSPFATFDRLSQVFPEHLVSFDQLISDDFSLKLVAHRPASFLVDIRSEYRLLISLGVISILSVYGLSLFLYLSSRARVRHAEVEAAHAMARASSLVRMKELEERFHRLVDASSIGQLVVDSDGRIEISNLAAERMLGYERGELERLLVDTLLPASLHEKHVHYRKQYLQAPEARMMGVGRELVAVRKDGSAIPVEVGLTPYSDQGRQLILVSIIDLSHRDGVARIS